MFYLHKTALNQAENLKFDLQTVAWWAIAPPSRTLVCRKFFVEKFSSKNKT